MGSDRRIMTQDFDVRNCNLEGVTVVEAGAGTGKTYNIAEIYLRLLLEGHVDSLEQILVVTFTDAATAELRMRLRARLEEARQTYWGDEGRRKILVKALADFDRAPVFTIHGFCQRMLNENAFESGIRYGKELRGTCSDIVEGAYADFFRRNNYAGHPLRTRIWKGLELTPYTISKDTRAVIGKEKDGAIVWNDGITESFGSERDLEEKEKRIAELENRILGYPPEDEAIAALQGKIRQGLPYNDSLPGPAANGDGGDSPASEASATLKELKDTLVAYRQSVHGWARKFAGMEILKAKSRENFMTFDDLLLDLRNRLKEHGLGERLRDIIRNRFRFAMIDEFQDTDNVQNEIFQCIFGDTSDAEGRKRGFFMIGDPKQAIYGFRGGDIFTYLDATGGTRKSQLRANFRSSKEYIGALNAMRKGRGEKTFFNTERIDFPEIEFPEEKETKRTLVRPDGEPISENLLTAGFCDDVGNAITCTVAEIKKLVESGNILIRTTGKEGTRTDRIGYGDIAVLARRNNDANKIAGELRKNGVPCVMQKAQNYYGTQEAAQLDELLRVLQDLSYQQKVNCFLRSGFFPRFTPGQIATLVNSDCLLSTKLLELRQLWEQKSFMSMFTRFMNSTMEELLGAEACKAIGQDGALTVSEAIIANSVPRGDTRPIAVFKQLQEALQNEATTQRLGVGGLAEFLRQRVAEGRIIDDKELNDKYPLRLTTEDPAVKIMTIHASKGLQFPIVFVLGMLNAPVKIKDDRAIGARFHVEEGGRNVAKYNMRTTAVAEGEKAPKELADQEELQENIRLLYVAATRAELLCRMMGGSTGKAYLYNDLNKPSEARERFDKWKYVTGLTNRKDSFQKRQNARDCLEKALNASSPGWEQGIPDGADWGILDTSHPSYTSKGNGWTEGSRLMEKHLDGIIPRFMTELNSEDFQAWVGGNEEIAVPEEGEPVVDSPVSEEFDSGTVMMPAGWRTCSYTAIARHKSPDGAAARETPKEPQANSIADDMDDAEDNPEADESAVDAAPAELEPIFRFPRGARAGSCWHKIFEELDFTQPISEQKPAYASTLKGFSQLSRNEDEQKARLEAFADMLEGVLGTQLPDPANPEKRLPFALNQIDMAHRRSELDFKYRLEKGFYAQRLFDGIDEIALPQEWAPEYKKESEWVLNGSIDLLFQAPDGKYYIVDWKTNALNSRREGFNRQGMQEEMDKHFYTLQYLLYTTAFLHAYAKSNTEWKLTQEAYDELFGGAIYCFVRGIHKGQGDANGFYATRPSFRLIDRLFHELTP